MASERELKYSLMDDHHPSAAELRAALQPAGFEVGQPRRIDQQDRYFDDARLSLSRAGLALRRRMGDGRILATLKSAGAVDGALHEREEIEAEIEERGWPAPVRERVEAVADPAGLKPVMEIDTDRLRYAVTRGGESLAILTFDAVEARYPQSDQSVLFDELEIEAVGDTPVATLEAIAAALDGLLRLTPNANTKLDRARALLMLGAGFGG